MKTKPLQYMTLKSFSPSSSSVSYTGKADGTTEVIRPLYFIEDKTNLRVKTGVDNFVVRYFVKSTGAHSQRRGDANTKLSKPGATHEQSPFVYTNPVFCLLYGLLRVRSGDSGVSPSQAPGTFS